VAKRYNSPITYRLREIPVKQIKIWKDAQARKLDREGIAELARSIKNDGLQNPPMVQRNETILIEDNGTQFNLMRKHYSLNWNI